MNTFSNPKEIIKQFPLEDQSHIADFGCGAGAYSFALAELKPLSKIFSIDVRREMVDSLQREMESKNVTNIHAIWGDVDEDRGSRLRDASIDIVLMANVLFQAEKKKDMLKEAARILKSNGRLIVIDWSESFGNIGPKEEDVVSERVAKNLAEECSLEFDKDIEAGEHHYGFIARKL